MTFERPGAWWLLALALPIIVLHLHLRRRRLVEVSSLELWYGLVPVRAGRGAFRNLRDGLALAFLLAALAAFSGAAAAPVTGAAATGPRRLTIVIDGSATMNAWTRPSEPRIDQALRSAIEAEARLSPQDELCVWIAGETPRVLVEPTTDRGAVYHGPIASLAPSTLVTTTRLARSAAAGVSKRPATVLVLTDEIGAEALKDLPPSDVDTRIGVIDGGRPAHNAGIVFCDLDPFGAGRVVVRVATTDGRPSPRTVTLYSRDRVELAHASLAADGTVTLPLGAAAAAGGFFQVELTPHDDFAVDDFAGLTLPAAKPLAVAVAADAPSPFLVEALRAMPDVVDPARTTLVAPGAPASAFEGADVVIADGVAAPAGKPVLVFGGTGRVVERPLLWGVGTHSVVAGADLSPLRIERAVRLDPSPGDVTIVASAAGPVGIAGETGGVRHVVFGFRPDASTLPLEAAFPLLVRNALRWLAKPADAPRYVVAGEPIPGGDGDVVPYPDPRLPLPTIRLKSGAETAVRWVAPRGFRLTPGEPVPETYAAEAVAALPDRHADADTRERLAPKLAAIGAALLVLGAVLLRPRRAAATAPPPATGIAWATPSREAARSPRS